MSISLNFDCQQKYLADASIIAMIANQLVLVTSVDIIPSCTPSVLNFSYVLFHTQLILLVLIQKKTHRHQGTYAVYNLFVYNLSNHASPFISILIYYFHLTLVIVLNILLLARSICLNS